VTYWKMMEATPMILHSFSLLCAATISRQRLTVYSILNTPFEGIAGSGAKGCRRRISKPVLPHVGRYAGRDSQRVRSEDLLFLSKPVESDAYNDTIQNIEALLAPALEEGGLATPAAIAVFSTFIRCAVEGG
jgi:hypothetical protein